MRAQLVGATLALLSVAPSLLAQRNNAPRPAAPFTVVEASIADLRSALEQKRTTSREIVLQYLTRIAKYEDKINAIITVNPNALAIADSMDRERAAGRIRGPLPKCATPLLLFGCFAFRPADQRTLCGPRSYRDGYELP